MSCRRGRYSMRTLVVGRCLSACRAMLAAAALCAGDCGLPRRCAAPSPPPPPARKRSYRRGSSAWPRRCRSCCRGGDGEHVCFCAVRQGAGNLWQPKATYNSRNQPKSAETARIRVYVKIPESGKNPGKEKSRNHCRTMISGFGGDCWTRTSDLLRVKIR